MMNDWIYKHNCNKKYCSIFSKKFTWVCVHVHLKKTTGESILRESIYIFREENLLIQLKLIARNYMKYMWP